MRAVTLIPSVLLCTAIAAPVLADVTPEDVWNDALATIKLFDQSVTADLERDGSTLVARNVTFRSSDAGTGGLSHTTKIEQIDLVNLGNGSVKMVFVSPVISRITGSKLQELGENTFRADVTTSATLSGEIIVTGDPDAMIYALDGADFEMLTEISGSDDLALAQTNETTVSNVSGALSSQKGATTVKGQFNIAADSYSYQMNQPGDEGSQMQLSASLSGYASEGDYEGPRDASTTDWSAALSALSARFAQSFETGVFEAQFADGDRPSASTLSGTVGQSWVDMSAVDGVASYEAKSTDFTAMLSGPSVPVKDAQISIANSGVTMSVPLTQRDEPQPFELGLSLEDVGMSASLWAMFDPLGELARDPATVTIQLTGDALVLDALTPTDPTSIVSSTMTKLSSLNLETFFVSFAGAKIDATGALTANSDGIAQMGLPDLIGSIDITLTNITDLIDTFTRIGLTPPQFGGLAQMMLGMLARPGPEVGVLVSHIERTADGQILANGLPLPF
ncbi:DUF2125 domain-containing protein [Celeribacter marinus]|uniref:DUF2125 domain-containing protein n=1 Tax=Celeribacter marinus TaxID=1397108 RepID=UPI003F6AB672